MIQNANMNGRKTWVKSGYFVQYGTAVFYKSMGGKLTTVCSVNPTRMSYIGKVYVIPHNRKD